MAAAVGCLYLDVLIPGAQSLKEKRRVLRRIKDKAQLKFKVAVAEISGQDLWQRAELAFVAVANERQHVDQTLAAVADWAELESGCVISSRRLEWR